MIGVGMKEYVSFGSPKSDTWKVFESLNSYCVCDLLKEQELKKHQEVADIGYQSLQADTDLAQNDSETYIVISFDLQQNLPTPCITTGLVFYLRQLWVCIHNYGTHDELCMWSENIVKYCIVIILLNVIMYIWLKIFSWNCALTKFLYDEVIVTTRVCLVTYQTDYSYIDFNYCIWE